MRGEGFRLVALLAVSMLLVACDPPYEYSPETAGPESVFPGVAVTPLPAVALIGSMYFSPPLLVENETDQPVVIVEAIATTYRGEAHPSWDRVHAVYRTAPASGNATISTSWFWDAAAIRMLGRRCSIRFVLQNGDRRAEMVVAYRRSR